MEKIEHGDILLVEANDKDIEEAMRRRKEKYRYFLKQMEVDSRYDAIMGSRSAKLREQNQQKERVLAKKRR
jgi:hypothetical protein